MSYLHCKYPLDHRVFSGGRYLRAFDHLPDIDHFEHSILTFLGSHMPFDKGFVDMAAFPSIATISRSTKISESTIRSRIRGLEKKGYLKVKTVRFINQQGKFQQGSNDYFLSSLAFEILDDVLESRERIAGIRKRAVGDNGPDQYCPSVLARPSPSNGGGESPLVECRPPLGMMPNSLCEFPIEGLIEPSSSYERDIFSMKAEVDRIAEAWEKLLNIPVSKGEKDRFFREYVRCNGNEVYYSERLLQISGDPYLTSRAKSLNFLFAGLDCALKNRAEIVRKGSLALLRSRSELEMNDTLNKIPSLVQGFSQNYGRPTEAIIEHLFQEPLKETKKHFGLKNREIVKNDRELKAEIQRLLKTELTDDQRSELQIISEALPRLNFGYCLELFHKFSRKLQVVETFQ